MNNLNGFFVFRFFYIQMHGWPECEVGQLLLSIPSVKGYRIKVLILAC